MSTCTCIETLVEKLSESLKDAEKHDRGVDAAGAASNHQFQPTNKARVCEAIATRESVYQLSSFI